MAGGGLQPIKEGQHRCPGIRSLAVGRPWPSHQETQVKWCSAATWLCDLGEVTPLLGVLEFSFLLMIPYAL